MEEVKVSGALLLILFTSRLVGVSPVSFRHSNDGYFVKFSSTTAMYRKYIITIINGLTVLAFIIDVKVYNNFLIGRFIDTMALIAMSSLLIYNAEAKTNSMIKNLAILNKITDQLSYLKDKSQSLDKRILVFCFGIWTIHILATAMNVQIFISMAQNLPDYIYFLLTYSNVQFITYEMELIVINLKVYEVLKNLTGELRNHLGLIESGQPTVISTQICIRTVAKAYMSICKVVNKINETDGKLILFLTAITIYYILHTTCNVIVLITYNAVYYFILIVLIWISVFILRLCLLLEPCQYILEEVVKIKILFSKLVCNTIAAGQPLAWDLQQIFDQLNSVEPTFTAFGIVPLNRSFLTLIISIITSYLTILFPYIKSIYTNNNYY